MPGRSWESNPTECSFTRKPRFPRQPCTPGCFDASRASRPLLGPRPRLRLSRRGNQSRASRSRVLRSIDVDEGIGIKQCQAKLGERAVLRQKLGHHLTFSRVGRAAEHNAANAFNLLCRLGPNQGWWCGRPGRLPIRARAGRSKGRACGAIVVTGRCGQLALVSGRSKTSKKRISEVPPDEDVEAPALAILSVGARPARPLPCC